jgi:hypothetical protein
VGKDDANHADEIPNPKTQIPNNFQSPILNSKDRDRLRLFWGFMFFQIPWDLVPGIWDFSAKRLHFD